MRLFPRIRMNFRVENHPCETFPVNQDQFPRRKSSLPDISCESGSISLLEIIPLRHFDQIRMHSTDENHLSQTFLANQDAFPRLKSSLQEETCKPGLLPHLNASPTASKSSRNSFPAITSFFSNRQLLISQHLFSHQAFSFPGLIRNNVQKLRGRRSNVLYAYILRLFSGLEIFSLDDERYGHILRRIGAVRSVMAAVIRGKP